MPHGPDLFLLQLLLIFAAAKLCGEVFEQLRLPAVLGELLAGVVLGPHAVGWIEPTHSVEAMAGLGAIFLLFTVGLETHPDDLLQVGRQSLGVAAAGVAVPFVLGYAYFRWHGNATHESIFVATAMVATSVGITARVLGDMGVLQSRAARIILAAAVFDDVLAMLLLAVVSGVAESGTVDWTSLGVLFVESAVFAIFMLFVAPRLLHRVKHKLEGSRSSNAQLVIALLLCLGLSAAAERIGMAAIIGAFFAGLAMAPFAHEWRLDSRVGAITEFLAPFFFFLLGAKLDLKLFTGDTLMVALVVFLLAVISKVIGCGLPVWKEGRLTALQVGVGMTPRGEVGLIVALIGLKMGTISDTAYAVVMFMTAATTLLAPLGLRVLFRNESPIRPGPA